MQDQNIEKENPVLTERTTITERYYFDGNYYTLYFDSEDTTGIPDNEETADSLLEAIGNIDFDLVYYDTVPSITFIEPVDVNTDSTATMAEFAPTVCLLAEFFENINFGGSSFCVDGLFDDHVGLFVGGNLVSEFIGEPDLDNRSLGGGHWEDKISSFKMFGNAPSKTWYNDRGYYGSNAKVRFALYRGLDYEKYSYSCRGKQWVMTLPYASTATWEVPNLKKEKWRGLFCNDMNDQTSSIAVMPCKSTICFVP